MSDDDMLVMAGQAAGAKIDCGQDFIDVSSPGGRFTAQLKRPVSADDLKTAIELLKMQAFQAS